MPRQVRTTAEEFAEEDMMKKLTIEPPRMWICRKPDWSLCIDGRHIASIERRDLDDLERELARLYAAHATLESL